MKQSKFIHKTRTRNRQKVTFIILCAAKSNTRGGKNIPLKHIGPDLLLIDEQIKKIRDMYDDSEVLLVVGFESENVINHIQAKNYKNIRIVENLLHKTTGVFDSWRIGTNCSTEGDLFLIHGDRLFNSNAIKIENLNRSYLYTHKKDKNNYNLGISYTDHRFMNLSYGLPSVWSEIFFVCEKDYNVYKSSLNSASKNKIYTVDHFINKLSSVIDIYIEDNENIDIKTLKEI